MRKTIITIIITAFFVTALNNLNAQTHNLKVVINDISNSGGNLMIAGFLGEKSFKTKENAAFNKKIKVDEESLTFSIPGLKTGKYAIAVFHDENEDSNMNTNNLGIPLEGFGFSGDYSIFSKPKFKNCSFELKNDTSIIINMHYLF